MQDQFIGFIFSDMMKNLHSNTLLHEENAYLIIFLSTIQKWSFGAKAHFKL